MLSGQWADGLVEVVLVVVAVEVEAVLAAAVTLPLLLLPLDSLQLLRLLWQSEAAYWGDAYAWFCPWLALLVPTVSAAGLGTAAVDDESAWAAACAYPVPPAAPPAGNGSVSPARWPCSAPANVA